MIKSIIKKSENYQEFPYLGIHKKDGLVVLFTGIYSEEGGTVKGTVVHIKKEDLRKLYSIGFYINSWVQNQFEPYSGTICLSNET